MESGFGFDANMKVEVFSADGGLKDSRAVHNSVTNDGCYCVMDQILAAPSMAKIGWMELGVGSSINVNVLGDGLPGTRVALTSKTRTNKVITMVGTWGPGVGTAAITEAGTFNVAAENTGPVCMYATFAAITRAQPIR